jgi:hypothetical protein
MAFRPWLQPINWPSQSDQMKLPVSRHMLTIAVLSRHFYDTQSRVERNSPNNPGDCFKGGSTFYKDNENPKRHSAQTPAVFVFYPRIMLVIAIILHQS